MYQWSADIKNDNVSVLTFVKLLTKNQFNTKFIMVL